MILLVLGLLTTQSRTLFCPIKTSAKENCLDLNAFIFYISSQNETVAIATKASHKK